MLDGLLTKDPGERLDLEGARRELQRVADRAPVGATSTLPMGSPAADPAAPASSTAALDLAEVEQAAQPVRPAPPVRPPLRRPPPVAPAGGRRPSGSGSGGRRAGLALAGVAVLAAGAVALALADDDEPDRSTAAPATSTAPSPTATASTAPAPETTQPAPPPSSAPAPTTPAPEEPAAAGVPAGWSTDTGAEGWTVALPPGYEQTGTGEYVQASTRRTLRVDTGPANPPAVADRQAQATDFAQRHPTYEEIRIEPVDYRGYEAADWEFTYEGLHVLNRVFVVGDRGYSLFLQTPEGDAEGGVADLRGIAEAFRPAGS